MPSSRRIEDNRVSAMALTTRTLAEHDRTDHDASSALRQAQSSRVREAARHMDFDLSDAVFAPSVQNLDGLTSMERFEAEEH